MNTITRKWLSITSFLLSWLIFPQAVGSAQSATQTLDIAVLGDGYTTSEMYQYQQDVNAFINKLYAEQPFKEYQRYISVHRVDVVSNQSGADYGADPTCTRAGINLGDYIGCFKDTALDAEFTSYPWTPITRSIKLNSNKVNTILANRLGAPALSMYDFVVVLVNDRRYGGTGNPYAILSTYGSVYGPWPPNVIHEIGHHFGLLADEYGSVNPPKTCAPTWESEAVNTANFVNKFNPLNRPPATDYKWSYWIPYGTPVPTPEWYFAFAGAYEGGVYCDYGIWRSSYNSKMRSNPDTPFNVVGVEQLVRRIYEFAPLVATTQPAANTTVTLMRGQAQNFSVTPVTTPLTHGFRSEWYIDGRLEDIGMLFTLPTHNLTPGSHTISLIFWDPTGWVRRDPQQLMVKQLKWTVNVIDTAIQPNPINDSRFLVRQHYRDFLSREPDAPGWDFWTNEITMCGSDAACIDAKRNNTSAAFFLSTEFQSSGYFLYLLYKGSLGRMPRFYEFVEDMQAVTKGIVVNNALSAQIIETNKRDFAEQFVNRADFNERYGSLSNAAYVQKLFDTTGVAVTEEEKRVLVEDLNAYRDTRAGVLRRVTDGTQMQTDGTIAFTTSYGKTFYNKEFNPGFVAMEYFGYLRRDPDPNGYNFWLAKLNQYGNWQDAEMVRAFLVSDEYSVRFGQP